jgi:hypothetical protein
MPLPNVACLRLSLLGSISLLSFFGTGGGKGPVGAGRIGRVVELKVGAVALADPPDAACSVELIVECFGTEFVVETRVGRPG